MIYVKLNQHHIDYTGKFYHFFYLDHYCLAYSLHISVWKED